MRERAIRQRFADPLLDRGDKLARYVAADDVLGELEAGPGRAARSCVSRAAGYRWWQRYPRRRMGRTPRATVDASPSAAPPVTSRRNRDRGRSGAHPNRAVDDRSAARAAHFHRRKSAAATRSLTPTSRTASTGAALRTSAPRATSSTATSRNSGGSRRSASGSAVTRCTAAAALAGSTRTSPSTITPGSPTSSCSQANA